MDNNLRVKIAVEQWTIPTYDFVEPEEMPMFSETSNHQGTTGDPYPARVISHVDGEHRSDKSWTVVTLENDYIRLAVIPALGGRIFEAYDKTTGYDFLYRQHVIKPALIGAYGGWMSGGIEFNWPYHHRPSTMMPVDYSLEECEDGSAIVWLSEHSPTDRTKGMVGVVLRPDKSYFETRVAVTNRTAHKHSFLWWENAAVAVHEDYKLVFPPDVTWVHHHYDRSHTTFPLASGQYGADNITVPKDISKHGNSPIATSYFAAPSKYDFFGGYDFRRNCGILHIAEHHISPGKKMFTWGYGANADKWEGKLTDSDGPYAELMAGSYTDDQPDFTWIAPFETKTFSQYWYPTEGIGYTSYATLDAAVALDREGGRIRVNVTSAMPECRLLVQGEDGRALLDEKASLSPSKVWEMPLDYPENEKLSVTVTSGGETILKYTEEDHDDIHIPEDNKGIPLPDKLSTACELVEAGKHIDQYRDPLYKPDLYYLEALRREPSFLPALKGLGEYYCRATRYADALEYLDRAYAVECRYNQNPEDGAVNYYRGLCLRALHRENEAYDALNRAAWSNNFASAALTALSEIDGCRGDLAAAYYHAKAALEKEFKHPLVRVYMALALYKSENGYPKHTYYATHCREFQQGDKKQLATILCREALRIDPLNHLAKFVLTLITGKGRRAFYESLSSSVAQTTLDLAFDLLRAGYIDETVTLIKGALPYSDDKVMLNYTLAYCYDLKGDGKAAKRARSVAKRARTVEFFPIRGGEAEVLGAAIEADPKDGFASFLLGCLRYNAREYKAAAALWESSIKALPDYYVTYRNLALVYFNHLDRAEDALDLLRRAVELHKGDATLLGEIETVMRKLGATGRENVEFLEKYKPQETTDQMQLTLARAYNAAGDFATAKRLMKTHKFSPGEGAELITAEPYMYALFAEGRLALKEGKAEEALECFREAQRMPENLNVGFWNESVLMPYLYFEAVALKECGRIDESKALFARLANLRDAGMWNMGGEFVYYYALSIGECGDYMRAKRIMREAILAWEKELEEGCRYHKKIGTLYNCFVGDGRRNRLSELYALLGYAELFCGNPEGAKERFKFSLSYDPTAKVALELSLLE